MKQLFFCLSIFLLFTSCKKNEPQPKISADTEITQKVKIFYGSYGKSSDAIYEAIPKDLLSADLEKTIQEVNDITNADIKKIKNSDHPTDKPKILETEGPIFTPAFTDYKIKSINLMENTKPVGMSADAVIELEDKNNPGSKWSNTVHLINTLDSGWRIDNVEFDKGNFKKTLQEFISK